MAVHVYSHERVWEAASPTGIMMHSLARCLPPRGAKIKTSGHFPNLRKWRFRRTTSRASVDQDGGSAPNFRPSHRSNEKSARDGGTTVQAPQALEYPSRAMPSLECRLQPGTANPGLLSPLTSLSSWQSAGLLVCEPIPPNGGDKSARDGISQKGGLRLSAGRVVALFWDEFLRRAARDWPAVCVGNP
jgi:hypothetical protein